MPAKMKRYISTVEKPRLILADLPGTDLLGTTSRLKPATNTGSRVTVMANVLPFMTKFFRAPVDIWISGAKSTMAYAATARIADKNTMK